MKIRQFNRLNRADKIKAIKSTKLVGDMTTTDRNIAATEVAVFSAAVEESIKVF